MVGVREGRRLLNEPLAGFLAARLRIYRRRELSERRTHYASTRYELPLHPLEPEARIAGALVELDPRHAPAP
jgi:hypothetical protein